MKPIRFYLPALADNDFAKLVNTVQDVGNDWPVLCGWLEEALSRELLRRFSDVGTPQDVDLLTLPGDWTNAELAEALEASTILSFCPDLPASVGELLDLIAIHVAAAAARRLEANGDGNVGESLLQIVRLSLANNVPESSAKECEQALVRIVAEAAGRLRDADTLARQIEGN